jgi:hypothetical protein
MSAHNLQDSVALLQRTPAALDSLLRGLPDTWISRNEGDDTWTVMDVLGHLIHAEHTDWIPRAKMILQSGDTRPFDTFDRRGYVADPQDSLARRLDGFADARAASLRDLRTMNLQGEDLDRRGRHPALGTVTLSQLLATWAAHDLTHLHQITRIMAHQYSEAVGPWAKFLGVLRCAGHSSP